MTGRDVGVLMWDAQVGALCRDLQLPTVACTTWQERIAQADQLVRAIRRRAGDREAIDELLDRATRLREAAQLAADTERENTH